MAKIDRKKLFNLLKNKEDKTFKELSMESGYHEKYLIKIYPLVIENKISYISKSRGKVSSKKISDSLCQEIKKLYQSKSWKTKKEFYKYLLNNNLFTPSYSVLCKILKKQINYNRLCVMTKYIINNQKIFVAFDYQTLKLLTLIRNVSTNKQAFHQLYKNLIINCGAPNYINCDSLFSHNKKYVDSYLKKFNIKKIDCNYYIKKAIRKIRKKLLLADYITNVKNINYYRCNYENKDFYYKTVTKINNDLTFQFKNIRYKVLNNNFQKNITTFIYYDELNAVHFIEQNNILSKVDLIKGVNSKKGLTKY